MLINAFRYGNLDNLLQWLRGMPMKLSLIISMLITVFGAALACNDNSTNNSNSNRISSPVLFFPVQREGMDQMEALLEGKLELDNGYLRVKYFDDNYLLIWPHGFSVLVEDEKIQIINRESQLWASVGDNILVGGGEANSVEMVEKYIGQKLPDDYVGPYWIISEVIDNTSSFP